MAFNIFEFNALGSHVAGMVLQTCVAGKNLEGDPNEYFQPNVQAKGIMRARLIYTLDVLKIFRPYTVRKPEFLNILIHSIIIRSYIRTSCRTIVRSKLP